MILDANGAKGQNGGNETDRTKRSKGIEETKVGLCMGINIYQWP